MLLFITLFLVALCLFLGLLFTYNPKLFKLLFDKSKLQRLFRAEELIYGMLPDEMADELLVGRKPKARHYSKVTIIFTDIRNFTQIAETYRPQELVAILNKYFTKFDEISSKYGVERIKTIGDSYMGVAGCPVRKKEHPVNAILSALEIQRWLAELEEDFKKKGEDYIQLKIGINTGEAVAGIIGKFRHAFDVWGDTVNLAFRLQESCEPGRINITEHTYKDIAPFFEVEERGLIKTKHKGAVKMFYVNGIKPHLRYKSGGPNELFWHHVTSHFHAKFDYAGLEKDFLAYLEQKLPKNLYYHGIHHSKYVAKAAEKIATKEGLNSEEVFLVKTAALMHDAGFTEEYKNNEEIGAEIARKWLPEYNYTEDQIDRVCKLILATSVPQDPGDILECVICDADLYYLGNPKFHEIADTLYHELLDRGVVKNKKQWDAIQIEFLSKHHYHTSFANKKAQPGKLRHLKEIKTRYAADAYPANTPL